MNEKLIFKKKLYLKHAFFKYLFWIVISTLLISLSMYQNNVGTYTSIIVVFCISLAVGILVFINRIRTYSKSSVTVTENCIRYMNVVGDGYEADVVFGRRKHVVFYNISAIENIKKCFGGFKIYGSGTCTDCKFVNSAEKKKNRKIKCLFIPAYYKNLEQAIDNYIGLRNGGSKNGQTVKSGRIQ